MGKKLEGGKFAMPENSERTKREIRAELREQNEQRCEESE